MEIITDVEKLAERCDEIDIRKENDLLRQIVLDLKNTIRDKDLIGLAAPQIGYNKRVFCINFKGDIRTFVNPVIQRVEGLNVSKETCPSLPGKEYIRIRNSVVYAMYQTPIGKIESRKFPGMAATVFQRLLDLLDGMVLSDVGLEIDDLYYKASEEERKELLNAYLDSLDLKQKEIEKEVEENPDLKQMKGAIDFLESVQKGETKLNNKVVKEEK